MLTNSEFEDLIKLPESSTLDFKAAMYDFKDDKDFTFIAKFIKDVISFINTIRDKTSYIIVGIEEKPDGTKNLCGLNEIFDDAIIQDKIKDKIFPRPHFSYYIVPYQEKKFGVFEFPVTRYSSPLYPAIKMKGLEIGKMYYRHGTSNTEALGLQVLQINNWLQSLPEQTSSQELNVLINSYIKRLNAGDENLSLIIIDILQAARTFGLKNLISFCTSEIQGLHSVDVKPDELKYRIQKVKMSLAKVEINNYAYVTPTISNLKSEMEKNEAFFDFKIIFSQPVRDIEEHLERFISNPSSLCATITMSSKQLLQGNEVKDYPVYAFVFQDTFASLIRNIRQELISILIKVQS